MRLWLMILALLVMPVQFVWAAAAPYCGHESSSAARKHFGHHEHRHQADSLSLATKGDDGDPAGTGDHPDCESCHLGTGASLPAPALAIVQLAPTRLIARPPARHLSHVPAGPERPDRTDLAAAVRSAGGVGFGLNHSG